MEKYTCPCCGYKTLDEEPPGTYDICPICFWEDDGIQFQNPNYEGGANHVSLRQAQKNFIEFGACEEEMIKCVRKPNNDDIKDINWKSLYDTEKSMKSYERIVDFNLIEEKFYNLFYNNLDIKVFEQWVYGSSELEKYLNSSDYLDLISLNYNDKSIKYEIEKIVSKYFEYGKFETYKTIQLL